ncbi:hypothetical protein CANCADRAFT_45603 [Tortispora caseinolytica NRRL Y-17796]|uniref:Eukaryotic translation initiation factor 3 subunit D n=1 Tax=Tortispora caseinolytica NRRL Y-17796 TaxID=767744 RepID=A0A1E4TBP9_9ASCO|nr:hypothetical protein CANCADRAFT_45603 [Tortispora caseinolytica NRRL Y-17796]
MSKSFKVPKFGEGATSWGPQALDPVLAGMDIPYAPFSKTDKIGKVADFLGEGPRERDRRSKKSEHQGYGASVSLFTIDQTEDDSNFNVVDSRRRAAAKGKAKLVRSRLGGPTNTRGAGRDSGRFPRGKPRRFGWKDYERPQRLRDASVTVQEDWKLIEEIDFSRLSVLTLDVGRGTDVETCGVVYPYDRSYDRVNVKLDKKLKALDRALYNPTTSDDPIVQKMAQSGDFSVFVADSILSMIMCAPKSVYPWDIIIVKENGKLFFDKREGGPIDLVSVNENAVEPPIEAEAGSKDIINTPAALALEALFINQNFANQVVLEGEENAHHMANPNPFHDPEDNSLPLASRGYRYRSFNIASSIETDPFPILVRTEVDADITNSTTGEPQFLSIKALNEFDTKAPGAGGALDWRQKLDSIPGAIMATEMKNNALKLSRWSIQALLAGIDTFKLGFVSRTNPKDNTDHTILGVKTYKPADFLSQMNTSVSNGWGIFRSIIDMCNKLPDGKYVLLKDPNQPILRIYEIPANAFETEYSDDEDSNAE